MSLGHSVEHMVCRMKVSWFLQMQEVDQDQNGKASMCGVHHECKFNHYNQEEKILTREYLG